MYLYVSKNIWDDPNSAIFNILQMADNLKIHTIDMDYFTNEPMVWRMMPLWDQEIEVLHLRDTDSIPTEIEYKYMRVFEQSDCSVGTLRTHPNHYGIRCRMLGGLSSFKPQQLPGPMKPDNFQTYYSFRHNKDSSDQDLLIKTFTSKFEYTKDEFLDHCAYGQKNPQDFPCKIVDAEMMHNIHISPEKQELFDLQKKNNLDNWAGEPVDARGEYTSFLLQKPQFENILNEMINKFGLREPNAL